MSNHARGLWGYHGSTPSGRTLTIQSTGMGGPSALLVLEDLAGLGVRRAVRVGTCIGLETKALGNLLLVREAIAAGGSAAALGVATGTVVSPDRDLTEGLAVELGSDGRLAVVASVDAYPPESLADAGALAADMQTALLLARAATLEIRLAALLIVSEQERGGSLEREDLEECEKRAGRAAAAILSG